MARTLPLTLAVLLALLLPGAAHAVVGGVPASQAYPHMAAMYYDSVDDPDRGLRFRCGASLIRPDVILTAAHCVYDDRDGDGEEELVPVDKVRYLVGTAKRSVGGETLQPAEIVAHELYHEPHFFSHDVAVVRLTSSATQGTPIRLGTPQERTPYWEPGVTARVIGWGTDAPQVGSVQDDLRELDIPIVHDDDCDLSYPSEFPIGEFEPLTMLCAGEPQGTKDSCQGDSGGPLMVKDATGAFMQVGIVSWGAFCAVPTQYGVYSRAAGQTLRTWIEERLAAFQPAPPPASQPLPPPPADAPPALPVAVSAAQSGPEDITALVTRKVRTGRRLEIGCRLEGKRLRSCEVVVYVKRRWRLVRLRTLTLHRGKTGVVRTGRARHIFLRGTLLAEDGDRYRVRRTLRRTT